MTEYKWQQQNRNLIEGDILRIEVTNKSHPDFGKFTYAICTGTGFGCKNHGMGESIFVYGCTTDLEELLARRNISRSKDDEGDKWGRFFPVHYLVE
jgi:hypothetical protein